MAFAQSEQNKKEQECAAKGKIVNPATKRCIAKDGQIGKAVLAQRRKTNDESDRKAQETILREIKERDEKKHTERDVSKEKEALARTSRLFKCVNKYTKAELNAQVDILNKRKALKKLKKEELCKELLSDLEVSDTRSISRSRDMNVERKEKEKEREEKEEKDRKRTRDPVSALGSQKKMKHMPPKETVYALLQTLDNTNNADEWLDIKNKLANAASTKRTHAILEHPEYALELDSYKEQEGFVLSRNQRFIKKFMSPHTRNKSILLFHGVGVGKTCTAIHVAEGTLNYRSNSKRTLVISSKNLKANFETNLYDISKRHDLSYESCVGTKYIQQIPNYKKMSRNELKKSLKKLIKLSYEFQGYFQFANEQHKRKKVASSDQYARYIHDEFSNRVIIVDEVHNVRINDKFNKKLPDVLLDISLFASNVKLVYLSATPMYNQASEIIWLMNSLMSNDNKLSTIIQTDDLFDENGELLTKVKKKYEGSRKTMSLL